MASAEHLSPTAAVLGEIGLPAPISQLASRRWDVIVVGAGHNGLACAAYLARAGKRVLIHLPKGRDGFFVLAVFELLDSGVEQILGAG